MEINGESLGKKFGKNWVFRNLNISIKKDDFIALKGPNGSGKSTLLQILSGYLSPSEGSVEYDGRPLDTDNFKRINFTGPYIELPEEMTFDEFLMFHSTFRKKNLTNQEIADKAQLPLDKRILEFSTGMKQRVQLSTAFYFENEVIFMDEPTANLDEQGFEWWKEEMKSKIDVPIVLASNQQKELDLSRSFIPLKDKKIP
jgi:ABC-type multidrug transport system ATPase subunit